MALNPLYNIDTLPTTSQAAIREFQDRYIASIGAAKPSGWADTMGSLIPTDAPMVTFPVSQLRTKYKRTEGENRVKKMREASFDVKTEEFDDGYRARLYDLMTKVFAYRNWQQAPARLLLAEEQLRHLSVAALLESGSTALGVDKQAFFSALHPVNMGDATVKTQVGASATWSNIQTTTKSVISIANIAAEVTSMMATPDENGIALGIQPDTILCPLAQVEGLKNLLSQAFIIGAGTNIGTGQQNASTNNPYLGRFNIIPVKEFTSLVDWYLVDSKAIQTFGIDPWVSLRQTVAPSLALRVFDESSDFFKDTGDLKINSHVWYGFGLAFPHAIRLVRGQ